MLFYSFFEIMNVSIRADLMLLLYAWGQKSSDLSDFPYNGSLHHPSPRRKAPIQTFIRVVLLCTLHSVIGGRKFCGQLC